MSDFCDFVPDAPECKIEEPAGEDMNGGDKMEGGDQMNGGKMMNEDMDKRDEAQMQANLTFLFTALGVSVGSALQLFRYRSDEDFYLIGEQLTSGNTWKWANLLQDYSMLALGGIAFITQLLSMFGIANEINLLVWMWGLGFVGMLVEAVAGLMMFYGYD